MKRFLKHQLMPWAFNPKEDGLVRAVQVWVCAQILVRITRSEEAIRRMYDEDRR